MQPIGQPAIPPMILSDPTCNVENTMTRIYGASFLEIHDVTKRAEDDCHIYATHLSIIVCLSGKIERRDLCLSGRLPALQGLKRHDCRGKRTWGFGCWWSATDQTHCRSLRTVWDDPCWQRWMTRPLQFCETHRSTCCLRHSAAAPNGHQLSRAQIPRDLNERPNTRA